MPMYGHTHDLFEKSVLYFDSLPCILLNGLSWNWPGAYEAVPKWLGLLWACQLLRDDNHISYLDKTERNVAN